MKTLDKYLKFRMIDGDFWKIQKKDGEIFYKIIFYELLDHGTISFPYNVGEYTTFDILLSIDFKQLGYPNSGGNTIGTLFLGIQRIGCFHFRLENPTHPSYIMEKLNLSNDSAEGITKLLNKLMEFKKEGLTKSILGKELFNK